MAARRKLIAGNWKMNGLREDGIALAGGLGSKAFGKTLACDVVVCPPATLLAKIDRAFDNNDIELGGQDCHTEAKGAFTGDVSAEMLRDAGCRYVIVGHSERRTAYGETNATVQAKAAAVIRAGMTAIVCVGETEAQRDSGETLSVIGTQVTGSLPAGARGDTAVIAYEPVWAIGTGRTATLDQIAEVHDHVRATLDDVLNGNAAGVRVLYGGSVKTDNAAGILALESVDGALVGGASLDAESFWQIVVAAGGA